MPPLTKGVLSSLDKVLDQIPDQTNAFRSQTDYQFKKRFKERMVFRKLLAKLSGNEKDDQIEFLINEARLISSQTYVKVTLKSIQKPPDYATLAKRNRQTHAHVHQLIDEILPIAAGSTSLISQMKVFENRWNFLHEEPFLKSAIKTLSDPMEIWNLAKLVIKQIPTDCDEPSHLEKIKENVLQELAKKTVKTLSDPMVI